MLVVIRIQNCVALAEYRCVPKMVGSSFSAMPVYLLTCYAITISGLFPRPRLKGTHSQMIDNVSLEAVDNRRCIVKESPDVRRGNVRSRTVERYPVPFDELVFSTVIPIVLYMTW
jgi:hypothetical protein